MAEADEAALKLSVQRLRKIVYELTRNEIEMRTALEVTSDYLKGDEKAPKQIAVSLQLPDSASLQKIQDDVIGADAAINSIGAPPSTRDLQKVADDLEASRRVVGDRLASH